jgi:hypothetical protein
MIERRRSYDAIDVLSLLASLLAMLLVIAGAVFMLLSSALYTELYGDLGIQNSTTTVSSLIMMGSIALALFFLSARALFGSQPLLSHKSSPNWLALVLIFPVIVWVGLGVYNNDLPAMLGPAVHTLGAAIPVFVAIVIVRLHGPTVSKRRIWGQFFTGVWATPTIAIVIEVAALGAMIIAIIVVLASSTTGRELINALMRPQIWNSPFDVEPIQALFEQPWVVGLLLMYIILVVPAIEEIVKTITIWPILRRPLSSLEAFLSGVLGGAGFALVEALFLTQPGSDWASTIVAGNRRGDQETPLETFPGSLLGICHPSRSMERCSGWHCIRNTQRRNTADHISDHPRQSFHCGGNHTSCRVELDRVWWIGALLKAPCGAIRSWRRIRIYLSAAQRSPNPLGNVTFLSRSLMSDWSRNWLGVMKYLFLSALTTSHVMDDVIHQTAKDNDCDRDIEWSHDRT